MDFTHCSGLGVTIGGETFRHLLFHLVLSHSGWSYAEVCFGETFAALVKGLQGALWELGGVPRVVRTDNLSAATHELRDSRGRAMNASYEAVLAHYGVEATRTSSLSPGFARPGASPRSTWLSTTSRRPRCHQAGVVEGDTDAVGMVAW